MAVGAAVRFTIAEADAAEVRGAIERARFWGHGSTLLTSDQGLYLTGQPRRWHETEDRYRLSIGSPLRRWLWASELAALSAVLAYVAEPPPPDPPPRAAARPAPSRWRAAAHPLPNPRTRSTG